MKKIIVAVIMLVLLFLHIPTTLDNILKTDGQYTFYTDDKVVSDRVNVVQNGNTYLVSCVLTQIGFVKRGVSSIKGESVKLVGNEKTVNDIISRLAGRISSKVEIEDIVIYEGFSPLLSGSVLSKGAKINFQIALSKGSVTIGRPVILGSF